MLNAFVWGFIAAFSLVIGGLIASWMTISQRTLGLIMAFGAGVLLSAVAYELVFEAVSAARTTGFPILGLFAGAATFFFSDRFVSGMVDSKADSAGSGDASSLVVPMVLGIILDGIPESVALGLGLLKGGTISIAMLVAVFISNLPEAIAGTSGLKASGSSTVKTLSLWLLIALVSGGASAAGFALLAGVPETWTAFVQTFAAGAILVMLANSMIPEAYEYSRKSAGLWLVLGFAVAVCVVVLERSSAG
ncbi:MAG: ZIP family zinc transporter [Gammaproteobacteria bacterium]